jgi:tRNA dimethylallyltransferase
VLEATGRPLADWQRAAAGEAAPYRFLRIVLLPGRAALEAAIDARFGEMLRAGALAEVAALLERRLDPALPAMKAVGLPELAAHLRGEIGLEEAAAAARSATRRYAKRQVTWLRGQMLGDQGVSQQLGHKATQFVIPSQFSECDSAEIFSNIRRFLLTALQQEA